MPFTTICFQETTQNTSLLPVAGLADDHVTVSGDDITIPELDQIIAALAFSANMDDAQLSSPSLRELFLEDLSQALAYATLPTLQAVDEGGVATFSILDGLGFNDFTKTPIPLVRSEKLNALVDNNNNSELTTVLVWLADRRPVPFEGMVRTIRATYASITATGAWASQTLTLSQTLPAGRYAVVGAHAIGANLQAMRFIPIGYSWRPGFIPAVTLSDSRPSIFRRGGLGVWFEFEFDQPPNIEALCTGATGAGEVYLDLVQVRKGR